MESVVFKFDDYLENTDLTLFEDGFKQLMEFIFKQVSTIVGTKKVFSKDIIKKVLLNEEGESFSVKVSIKKARTEDLAIYMFAQSPSGFICIMWNNKYSTKEKLESDIDYIVSNINKIKENQEV